MKRLALDFGVMKKAKLFGLAVLAVLLGSSDVAKAATYTVAQTGKWSESTTWSGTVPSSTITLNEDITINIPDDVTLTIDENVSITQNGLYVLTLSGGSTGQIVISEGKNFTLKNNAATKQETKDKNRVNLQCDIEILENATLELDALNVAFDFDGGHDITGSGTVNFSRTGGGDRMRIQVSNLTKPIIGCNILFASNQKFTYENSCTYVLPGTYWNMSTRATSMYVYDKVIVTNESWLEAGGITYISKSDKAEMSFNKFTGGSGQPLTFNVDVTLTGSDFSKVSSLAVADTNTLTIAADITWKDAFAVPKNLVIASGYTLNMGGDHTIPGNVDIADGSVLRFYNDKTITFGSDANITGNGQMLFAGSTTIKSLNNCVECITTFAEGKTITYDNTCSRILEGTYTNLTTNNSGTLTLCGNVVVNGTYKLNSDIIINGETGNETITFNGPITNGKYLTLNVNAELYGEGVSHNIWALKACEGKTVTFKASSTIERDDVRLFGSINVDEGKTLSILSGNLYFGTAAGNTAATNNTTLSGNFYVSARGTNTGVQIQYLDACVGGNFTFNETNTVTYNTNCTNIIAGTYTNLTTNNSGTLTLCGDVVVNGTYRLNNDIIIKGETGNETITYNGPITNNKSLALMVNAFANGTNNYSVSRFNIGKNKTFTINGATTITSNVNIDSTGMINVADDATLTFSGNTTFNTSTTINGNGNVYFNAYVKAQGAKLTTYPTVTLADVGSNMLIDTIEVKGGTFNYNRSNTDYNQRPIRSLIVDGGTFALNIPNWASMNLTGAAILKSGTLQMAAGKTLKLTNTDCDTLKVTGTATIDGNGVIDAVVAVYANGRHALPKI